MATSLHSAQEGPDELRGAALSAVSALVLALGVLVLADIAAFPARAGLAPLFIAAGLALTSVHLRSLAYGGMTCTG